ncbi:hypothetical protein ALP68_101904 [Pseudomonas ficuserectae]|uniref:Uncharacterized protein n=2 Tax=Pseudomonas syringae group genomosp. 2 TaxID=251698 RepID=A0A3M5KFL2_PSESS|nr:hypothetical protein ALO82_101944 [Pseudomonas syringae pv. broussonetiae]KPX45148.1 hypothetical protein ALO69_102166 [Pseudomonas ficuserectae]KPX83241.1 hypothetical protein ALO63_102060 [Pseudomonas amygdali pv. mori]RMS16773.1 hypothetical protein ALP70_102055 [Pseudomonas savastanoi]RMQ32497.1 hypothetical protein ALQ05_101519 [Pseudomonas amygdali pv. mori]
MWMEELCKIPDCWFGHEVWGAMSLEVMPDSIRLLFGPFRDIL